MAYCQLSITAAKNPLLHSALAALVLGLAGCWQSDQAIPPTGEKTEPQLTAEEVLSKMRAFYREADSYSDQANYVRRRVRRSEGVSREITLFEMSLALEKPNKVRFIYRRLFPPSQRQVGYDVASDGEFVRSMTRELPEQVHETRAPEQLTPENFIPEPAIRKAALEVSLENIYPQLLMLLASSDAEPIFPGNSERYLMSPEKLGEDLCYRVVMESPAGKRTLWIDAVRFSLRRMELPLAGQMPLLDPHRQFSHYSVWIDYLQPTVNATHAPEQFVMHVPEGSRRVSRLVPPPPPGPSPLLGKPVAQFSFTTLAGEEITPASHAGNVVAMEFWTTTCPPCREHTPVLEQVYQRFKDEDRFVFYAVNADTARAGLTNQQVARTFENWGGTFPVLRDLEETSDHQLGIRAYPHMIIVGPDERLQMYQAGMHTSPEPLSDTIRKLLDGRDLAAEALDKHRELVQKYEQDLDAVAIH